MPLPAVVPSIPAPSQSPSNPPSVPAPQPSPPQPSPTSSSQPLDSVVTSASTGLKLTLIPAGTFRMGSPASEAKRLPIEGPQHTVRISQPFYMSAYEVTQGEYEQVMGTNPSKFSSKLSGQGKSKLPVVNVSWYDAIEFCNKLCAQDGFPAYYTLTTAPRASGSIQSASVSVAGGKGYRLPTEAEWEYACRANTTTPFHFGSVLNGDNANANVNVNDPYGTTTKGNYLKQMTTVGSYPANSFGLHDMHGNVWEWCCDVYDKAAYQGRSGTTVDPLTKTGSESRVLRGGSWNLNAWYMRSAHREGNTPDNGADDIGFRVVCVGVRVP